MQSVMRPFRDITALNIIDFVNQLLRGTGSGTVLHASHMVHLVRPQ